MQYRNRITGEGVEAPENLLANPANWRTHPKGQKDALRGVLNEVGFVQRVIVNQRTGFVVDGHARIEVALQEGQQEIPVLYVDLSVEEEALILATLDPLGALAGKDDNQLSALLDRVSADNGELQAILDELAMTLGSTTTEPPEPKPSEPSEVWILGGHKLKVGVEHTPGEVEHIVAAWEGFTGKKARIEAE